jgi:hypothetical protein
MTFQRSYFVAGHDRLVVTVSEREPSLSPQRPAAVLLNPGNSGIAFDPARRPCPVATATISPAVIDLDRVDFKLFGITAIRVMRGTDVVRAWVMR